MIPSYVGAIEVFGDDAGMPESIKAPQAGKGTCRGGTSLPRLQSIVLSSFGIAALSLAILGVYGVLAYWVSLRTPEFGIRVALGSSKVSLIRLVLLEALAPVGGGIALGLLTSLAATRAIRSLLYETSPTDPTSIVTSVGILFVATFVAAFMPAYRASRIDPMKVLRSE
jgi:ABC-type antimicrobial peptide transport system permease subunit